ncbi:MAG: S-layer homology domain-containing protein [Tissierellia bacterium]|nr:S-layer homology domain-containing protein [Tissierellia bacterium]
MALALCFILGAAFTVEAKGPYEDIVEHWSELNVARGIELGWIRGYEDGTVQPDGTMARSEFVSLMMRSLDHLAVAPVAASQYGDIDQVLWASEDLRTAEALGILPHVFPGEILAADQPLTREEAAAILDYTLTLHSAFTETGDGPEAVALAQERMSEKVE